MRESLSTMDTTVAAMLANAGLVETGGLRGHYDIRCVDADGVEQWSAGVDNVVTTVGQNQLLAAALQGSAYTVTGPYMMLISSASFSAVSVNDTMASHSGWLEADASNAPEYSGNRPTVSFNAPSGGTITSSGAISFAFTQAGTIQGIAMTYGSGAVNTQGSTAGTLLSAGTLATAQPVISGNTVIASYTLAL